MALSRRSIPIPHAAESSGERIAGIYVAPGRVTADRQPQISVVES